MDDVQDDDPEVGEHSPQDRDLEDQQDDDPKVGGECM
jgi:hypothetical protein